MASTKRHSGEMLKRQLAEAPAGMKNTGKHHSTIPGPINVDSFRPRPRETRIFNTSGPDMVTSGSILIRHQQREAVYNVLES